MNGSTRLKGASVAFAKRAKAGREGKTGRCGPRGHKATLALRTRAVPELRPGSNTTAPPGAANGESFCRLLARTGLRSGRLPAEGQDQPRKRGPELASRPHLPPRTNAGKQSSLRRLRKLVCVERREASVPKGTRDASQASRRARR